MSTLEQDKSQVFETQQEIREMKVEMSEQRELIKDIHTAIMGSSLTRDGGLVQRLKDVERRQREQEEKLQKIEEQRIKYEEKKKEDDRMRKRIWTIITAAAGVIGFIISEFFKK